MSRQRDENRAISRELLIKSKPCIARQIANQFWSSCLLKYRYAVSRDSLVYMLYVVKFFLLFKQTLKLVMDPALGPGMNKGLTLGIGPENLSVLLKFHQLKS